MAYLVAILKLMLHGRASQRRRIQKIRNIHEHTSTLIDMKNVGRKDLSTVLVLEQLSILKCYNLGVEGW